MHFWCDAKPVNSTIGQPIRNIECSMTFSLTNLLQSLSGLLFAIVLHFLFEFGQLSADRPAGGPCVSAYHLANQIQWPSFSSQQQTFLRSASAVATRRLLCVHSYCCPCLLSLSSQFCFNIFSIFGFVILRPCPMHFATKTIRFLTRIYDP